MIRRAKTDTVDEPIPEVKCTLTKTEKIYSCPHCNGQIFPASMMGQGKKTMTQSAIDARTSNASKPRPNAKGKLKPRNVK